MRIAFGRQVCGDARRGRRARVAGHRRASAATRWAPSRACAPAATTACWSRPVAGVAARMSGLPRSTPWSWSATAVTAGHARVVDGVVDPAGHEHCSSLRARRRGAALALADRRRRARARAGDGARAPAVAVVHRLSRRGGPVRLELTPLCTWRDAHGERHAGAARGRAAADGFVFEDAYRVRRAGWSPVATGTAASASARRRPAGCPTARTCGPPGASPPTCDPGEAARWRRGPATSGAARRRATRS